VVDRPADSSPIVPQRATIVVSSTAQFHSRQFRISRSLVERGHQVTVIARWEPGVPWEEWHPAGFRILRITAGPLDGIPVLGRWRERRARGARGDNAQTSTARTSTAPTRRSGTRLATARRAVAPFARSLTIRGLTAAAGRVAPVADLYHAMTNTRIPIGLALARRDGAKVIYDAADIYLDSGELSGLRGPGRWWLARSERRAARVADRVVTVNDAYAEVLERRFGVDPLVVMNCSDLPDPAPVNERRFHRLLGLLDQAPVVLYHGHFYPHRGIEQLVEAIDQVDDAVLVLMGSGPLESEVRAAAGESMGRRVHIVAPVPPEELLGWVASADVVAVPIQPSSLNHQLSTPNKLFEAMAAGVPVVASDLPGMAPIVRETGCGVLVDPTDVLALARAITSIVGAPPAERAAYRDRALDAARKKYNWERQLTGLLDEYTRLTGKRW
jgi:glycosyltransferase involved in cell wall biosynthesis